MTANRYIGYLAYISKRISQFFIQRGIDVDIELGYPRKPSIDTESYPAGHLIVHWPKPNQDLKHNPYSIKYLSDVPTSHFGIINAALKYKNFKTVAHTDVVDNTISVQVTLLDID